MSDQTTRTMQCPCCGTVFTDATLHDTALFLVQARARIAELERSCEVLRNEIARRNRTALRKGKL